MIRISVTELESYRYWKDSEDSTMEELVARLRRQEPPTPQMEAGRAFAKLMENAERYQVSDAFGDTGILTATVDGWTFHFRIEEEIALPPARELKGELHFTTAAGDVTLVAKCDGLDGDVHDQKLTERWDAERYLDSLQWRSYLVMFGAKRFVYDVFVGRYDSKGAQEVTINEYHALPFYAYPGIENDVAAAVAELAEVIARHLPERVLPDEARAA